MRWVNGTSVRSLCTSQAWVVVPSARWPLEWGQWIQALLSETRGDTGQARALLDDTWELAAPLRSACPTGSWGPTWSAWRSRRATGGEPQPWLTR
jgi:hypothetical protein